MRIAIIGAGISGLTVAYRLHRAHDITLFEAADRLGGHARTIEVDCDGRTVPLDVGFMVFNDRTYPNFAQLLDELGVASRPTSMSFSVADPRHNFEYNGGSLGGLVAQPRNIFRPSFYRMLRDILRFNRTARSLVATTGLTATVADYLTEHRYSNSFVEQYLLPMGAAIWSCPTATFANFPIRFVAEFFDNHGLLNLVDRPTWRVIEGGSQTYVTAMTRGFNDRIRLNAPIAGVRRFADCVGVQPLGGSIEAFDHVVFACHSDQALRILGADATPTERDVLGAFPYQKNSAVLHTDESLLPRSPRARACWNVRLTGDRRLPAVTTYDLNQLQHVDSKRTYCVTLNADERVAQSEVLQAMTFEHPHFDSRRDAAQTRHSELLCANRTSFCGAYWRNGFHEDGVVSALAVVRAIDRSPTQRRFSGSDVLGAAS